MSIWRRSVCRQSGGWETPDELRSGISCVLDAVMPTQSEPRYHFLSDDPQGKGASNTIDAYTKAIVDTLRARLRPDGSHVDTPFSVAVYGDWGVGKTSLMEALKAQVEDDSAAEGAGTAIWFEPWRFETEDNLLSPLLAEIISVTSTRLRKSAAKDAAIETGKRLFGRVAKATVRTGVNAAARLAGVRAEDLERLGEDFARFYGEAQAEYDIAKSETEAFREDFNKLIALAGSRTNIIKPKRDRLVCIFIDDLDRCQPSQVVRLLEAIKLFLWAKGVVFFLALDQSQIINALMEQRAAERQASTSPDDLRAEAAAYLEKFFLYSIDLDLDTGFLKSTVLPTQREMLWADFEASINAMPAKNPALPHPKAFKGTFECVKPNLRKMKRALRWLYFEYQLPDFSENSSRVRFTEMVIEENYPSVWSGYLKELPARVRASIYDQIVEIWGAFSDPESDRVNTESLFRSLQLLQDGAAEEDILNTMEDEIGSTTILSLKKILGTSVGDLLAQLAMADDWQELKRLFDLAFELSKGLREFQPV